MSSQNIDQVTASMEGVSFYNNGDTAQSDDHYSLCQRNGPPVAHPVPFKPPEIRRGRRESVLVWHSRTQQHKQMDNVLLSPKAEKGYSPIPHKRPIKTIMGHVEICLVLQRTPKEKEDEEDEDESENESSQELGIDEEDDEDDVVFELTKEKVAIKVNYSDRIESLKHKHAEDPLKEIAAMQHIGNTHPHVLGVLDVLYDGKNVNVVLPYCQGGDLFELLQDNMQQQQQEQPPGMPEVQAKRLFRQIIDGVQYLHHSKHVCHRDLSPENIMLQQTDDDPSNSAVIIDMGMCFQYPPHRLLSPQGTCGKLPYMSPEVYANKSAFDPELVDVWTCGTILWCMLTGNRSYQRAHPSDAQFYWMTHGIERLLHDWGVTHLSQEAVQILKGTLQIDPQQRMCLRDLKNHSWLK